MKKTAAPVRPAIPPANPEMPALTAWCNGACARNPGPMGIGGVVKTASGVTLAQFSQAVGVGTNNIAEYLAVLQVLELARQLGAGQLTIWTDSQLVVRQLRRSCAVRDNRLQALWRQVKSAQRAFPAGTSIRWMPRERNPEADALATRTLG